MACKWGFFDRMLSRLRSKKALSFIKNKPVLLDIGCGSPPMFLSFLLENELISKGYGVDKKPLIEKMPNLIVFNMDLEASKQASKQARIPLPDKSVDVVTMLAVIEHIWDPTWILSEVKRVLNDAGLFIVTTPTPLAKPVLELLAFIRIINPAEIKDHKKYYSEKELLSLLRGSGFKVIYYRKFEFLMNQIAVSVKKEGVRV